MVNGTVVLRDNELTQVDENEILREVREATQAYLAEHQEVEERNRALEPYMIDIHRRATIRDVGLNRYIGDIPHWSGTNQV